MREQPRTRVVHVRDNVPGAVYIGRAMPRQGLKASPFANPHKIGPGVSRQTAITRYEEHLVSHRDLWAELPALRGKALACWCRHDGEAITPDTRCHGDVLANLLNTFSDDELLQMAQGTYS